MANLLRLLMSLEERNRFDELQQRIAQLKCTIEYLEPAEPKENMLPKLSSLLNGDKQATDLDEQTLPKQQNEQAQEVRKNPMAHEPEFNDLYGENSSQHFTNNSIKKENNSLIKQIRQKKLESKKSYSFVQSQMYEHTKHWNRQVILNNLQKRKAKDIDSPTFKTIEKKLLKAQIINDKVKLNKEKPEKYFHTEFWKYGVEDLVQLDEQLMRLNTEDCIEKYIAEVAATRTASINIIDSIRRYRNEDGPFTYKNVKPLPKDEAKYETAVEALPESKVIKTKKVKTLDQEWLKSMLELDETDENYIQFTTQRRIWLSTALSRLATSLGIAYNVRLKAFSSELTDQPEVRNKLVKLKQEYTKCYKKIKARSEAYYEIEVEDYNEILKNDPNEHLSVITIVKKYPPTNILHFNEFEVLPNLDDSYTDIFYESTSILSELSELESTSTCSEYMDSPNDLSNDNHSLDEEEENYVDETSTKKI